MTMVEGEKLIKWVQSYDYPAKVTRHVSQNRDFLEKVGPTFISNWIKVKGQKWDPWILLIYRESICHGYPYIWGGNKLTKQFLQNSRIICKFFLKFMYVFGHLFSTVEIVKFKF